VGFGVSCEYNEGGQGGEEGVSLRWKVIAMHGIGGCWIVKDME